jgi:4-methyl-5(b-hydroxyethyl)-thiazole monophosphate biosynthesis
MSKKVLVPIADGSEEIEAVCIIDVLRRAGAEVTVASVMADLTVTASRGVKIVADKGIAECESGEFDLIVLPGGMPGAEHLRDSETLVRMLKKQKENGRLHGAICAAPAVVFERHGLLEGVRATAHPGFIDKLDDTRALMDRVVVDGAVVTSRGPGTAIEFALRLVAILYDEGKAREIAGAMVVG